MTPLKVVCPLFSSRILSLNRSNLQRLFKVSAKTKMASNSGKSTVDEAGFAMMCKQLAPPLNNDKYKGQAGKIGVFGGSTEYTGAPYFAAIGALKVGADLVHVFTTKGAAPVIKSYSPELMVHPYLDDNSAIAKIEPWLDRMNVVLIGCGLGREQPIFDTITKVFELCRAKQKPLIVDADGLFLIAQHPEIIRNYPKPGIILTPNKMEFARLIGLSSVTAPGEDTAKRTADFLQLGQNITILCKGAEDEIFDATKKVVVSGGGSGRRCGGQGDLLAGSLATFYCWALQHHVEADVPHDDRAMIAAYSACKLTRECNARGFVKKGRSMVVTDMIEEVHGVFEDLFELN